MTKARRAVLKQDGPAQGQLPTVLHGLGMDEDGDDTMAFA